jgi:hypothetical protein
LQLVRRVRARGHLADDFELDRCICHIRGAHGIAVDSRVGEGGHVLTGVDCRSQHSANGLLDRQ